MEAPPWGIAYQDGRVRAELDANRLLVTEARIASGEGELTASGTLALGARSGDAQLGGKAVPRARQARPAPGGLGKGRASFDGKRFGVKGELRADSGHFEIAPIRCRARRRRRGAGRPPARCAWRKQGPLPLDLDLKLDLGSRLTLRAYGFNGGVTGQVRVYTGPAGELLAKGRSRRSKPPSWPTARSSRSIRVVIFDGPIGNPRSRSPPGAATSRWKRACA